MYAIRSYYGFTLLRTSMRSRLAIIAVHICIAMAFTLSPRKYFNGNVITSYSIHYTKLYDYYYDDFLTNDRLNWLVYDSYLNANRTIAEMIRSSNGKFKCAFVITSYSIHYTKLYDSYCQKNSLLG